jgi:beta-glucanase (GH16 family)
MQYSSSARSIRATLVAASLVVAGVAVGAPAQAAPSAVTIATLASRTVAASATTSVTPAYSVRKGVRVRKATVDVRRGSAWMARKARQARVPAGSYRVTTRVTYRESRGGRLGPVRTAQRTQTLRVTARTVPAAAAPAPAPTPTPTPTPVPSLARTSSACVDPSLVKADGTPWTCTFSDEFTGPSLDRTKWTPVETRTSGYQLGADCYVDDPANVSVGGGALSLTVRRLAQPIACPGARPGDEQLQHTAGSVISTFAQSRGRFEIRAAFPTTRVAGQQSALWLFPKDPVQAFPYSGEIDVAEMFSQYGQQVVPNIHYGHWDPSVTNQSFYLDDVSTFHTYTLEWTPRTISIAVDGRVAVTHSIASLDVDPFSRAFQLVLTQGLGVGANAATAATPDVGTTRIDYVRVWS